MTDGGWVKLRIEISQLDDSFDDLAPDEQDEALRALELYANTGKGSAVTYRAPGYGTESDVIAGDGVDIDVEIWRNRGDPALLVIGFTLAPPTAFDGDA